MQMPFGKYAGEELEDIPVSYLEWLIQNVELRNPLLREEVEELTGCCAPDFSARNGTGWKKRASGGSAGGTKTVPPTAGGPELRGRLVDAVGRWRGQLARRFHPDRGGDPDVMKAINSASDDLLAAIDEALRR